MRHNVRGGERCCSGVGGGDEELITGGVVPLLITWSQLAIRSMVICTLSAMP
uniref:Uncharacterized protein n=1 Tax=Arundo donax TaxID=35708 RepID=A0A0A8ZER2_ARUDO